jgi:hypothetical protein
MRALSRAEGKVAATKVEVDTRLTGENLPAVPDAQHPRLVKRDISPVAIIQGMTALQPLSEKAVAKREAESIAITHASTPHVLSADRQDSRDEPLSTALLRTDASGSGILLPPETTTHGDAVPIDTYREAQSLGQTLNQRGQKSRAEDIVLEAIRSKADTDGKNAKVAYDVLAAMTGFSRRHVIRAVKSLIFERGRLRVDKRVLRPGHNAINVYQVVNRDATATEKGIDMKVGKTRQSETTRVTEHVTQIAEPRTIPSLHHAPLSRAIITDKPESTYLTAGRKPRYFTKGVTPREKVA